MRFINVKKDCEIETMLPGVVTTVERVNGSIRSVELRSGKHMMRIALDGYSTLEVQAAEPPKLVKKYVAVATIPDAGSLQAVEFDKEHKRDEWVADKTRDLPDGTTFVVSEVEVAEPQ